MPLPPGDCGVFAFVREQIATMPESKSNSIHLVVQHTQTEGESSFRIVAFCEDARFKPAEFASRDELLRVLRSSLPRFDERWLVLRECEYRGTYIAFIGDFELDQSQLLQMGVRAL